MGKDWTDDQLLTLGYDPSKFRGQKIKAPNQTVDFSMSAENKDRQNMCFSTKPNENVSTDFFKLCLENRDPMLTLIKK